MSITDRIRPNVEAAPWVIEEIKVLEKAYYEQEEELDATMMAFNIFKKENEQLRAMLTSIKQSLIEISIQSEGTVMAIDEMETNKVL
jgi:DNA polymerase III delta prime subunit